MLDVHPPEHAAHSWRDFFIHIATIVVGLLIAVALEQTVEFLHHRHEVAEARTALAAEHRENIHRYHLNVRDHLTRLAAFHNNERILRYLLEHPGARAEDLPGVMGWGPITLKEPVEAEWSVVEHTNVSSLLAPEEMRGYAAEYIQLDDEAVMFHHLQDLIANCAAFLTHTPDVTKLAHDELQHTLDCETQGQTYESIFGDQLSVIGNRDDYGPAIDWWKMIPFLQMSEAHALGETYPKAAAVTRRDRKEALSALPDWKDLPAKSGFNDEAKRSH